MLCISVGKCKQDESIRENTLENLNIKYFFPERNKPNTLGLYKGDLTYQPHIVQGHRLRMTLILYNVLERKKTFYILTWCESFSSLRVKSSVYVNVKTEMR